MFRLRLGMLVAGLLAMAISACGAVNSAASSIIAPCERTQYDELVWSPDGQHIAFQESRPSYRAVVVMNADGTAVQRLTHSTQWYSDLRWLADSQSLAFDDGSKVIVANLDQTLYERTIPAAGLASIAISPDANQVIIEQYRDPRWSIAVFDPTTGDFGRPFPLPFDRNDYKFVWSPDGAHLAYVHTGVNSPFITTSNPNGSGLRTLTKGLPPIQWSPDGKWLSFNTYNGELHIIESNGSNEKWITAEALHSQHFWLPDSQHIAFMSNIPQGGFKVIDIDSLAEESLVVVQTNPAVHMAWSPDGSQAVFAAFDTAHNASGVFEETFVINRDGSGLTRLTDNPGRYQCFNWPF